MAMERSVLWFAIVVSITQGTIAQPSSAKKCPVDKSVCECKMETIDSKKEFTLDCSGQNLKFFPKISSAENVFRANFQKNQLVRIRKNDLKDLTMEELNLQNNDLVGIHKDAFMGLEDSLKSLDLSSNDFKKFPNRGYQRLTSLEYLSLANNRKLFARTGKLPGKMFADLKSLKTLDLSKNRINGIAGKAFIGLENTLDYVILSYESLKTFPAAINTMTKLTKLDLQKSGKYKIPSNAFNRLTNLKELDLSQVDLSTKNALTDDSFAGLESKLEILSMSKCKLTKFPEAVKQLLLLKKLDLSYNNIKLLDKETFANFLSLEELDIGGFPTEFSTDVFIPIAPTLKRLGLSHMKISKVPPKLLSSLPMLNDIDLSYNSLETIPSYFTKGTSVVNYNLAVNDIKNIEKFAFVVPQNGKPLNVSFKNTRLENVDFVVNPCIFSELNFERLRFRCSCQLYELFKSDIKVKGHCTHKSKVIPIETGNFENYYSHNCKNSVIKSCKTTVKPTEMTTEATPDSIELVGTLNKTISDNTSIPVDSVAESATQNVNNSMSNEMAETTPFDPWPSNIDNKITDMIKESEQNEKSTMNNRVIKPTEIGMSEPYSNETDLVDNNKDNINQTMDISTIPGAKEIVSIQDQVTEIMLKTGMTDITSTQTKDKSAKPEVEKSKTNESIIVDNDVFDKSFDSTDNKMTTVQADQGIMVSTLPMDEQSVMPTFADVTIEIYESKNAFSEEIEAMTTLRPQPNNEFTEIDDYMGTQRPNKENYNLFDQGKPDIEGNTVLYPQIKNENDNSVTNDKEREYEKTEIPKPETTMYIIGKAEEQEPDEMTNIEIKGSEMEDTNNDQTGQVGSVANDDNPGGKSSHLHISSFLSVLTFIIVVLQ